MYSQFFLLFLFIFALFYGNNSIEGCNKYSKSDCGKGCTGTPACDGRRCGNVDNMCYCDCVDDNSCKTTELGYKWNGGIKLANGSYALNGTRGDGREYVCN